jgi:hypothetical protein
MKKFIISYWYVLLLTLFGILGGFLYWRLIGCNSGSCPITSHWHTSSVVGGIMGYLTGSIIYDFRKKYPGK